MTRANSLSHQQNHLVEDSSGKGRRVDFKSLLKYKTVLLLSCVLLINIEVSLLILQLDLFVHGDLYAYGLIYSIDWADSYWNFTTMLWVFLGVASALMVSAIVPHVLYSRKITRLSKWAGSLLSVLALAFEGLGIFYLTQKNSIVWNTLRNYGVQHDVSWATIYNLMSVPALALMIIALLALIVPSLRATGYEIQITSE